MRLTKKRLSTEEKIYNQNVLRNTNGHEYETVKLCGGPVVFLMQEFLTV